MTVAVDYVDNSSEGGLNLIERKKSERQCTDLAHFLMFGIFLALWIGIAVHAYSAGYYGVDIPKSEDIQEGLSKISALILQSSGTCTFFVWLCVLFLGLYFMAIRFLTKYVIYATIVLQFLLSIMVLLFILGSNFPLILGIPIMAACFIFYVMTLYTYEKVGYEIISNVVQDSCKAMACLPSSILISFAHLILMKLVYIFTVSVIFGLVTIPKEPLPSLKKHHNFEPPYYVPALLLAFVSCSIWVMIVIYNMGRTTLYGMFCTWCRTADKKKIPSTLIFRIMYTNMSYHMGTIIFGSTIFTIVQIIRSIHNNWIDLHGKFRARKINIFCFIVVVLNATSNTFLTCVSYGTGYLRSMHDSFKLLMLNPSKFAATRVLTEWMIFYGVVLIPGATIALAASYIMPNVNHDSRELADHVALSIIIFVSISITAIFLATLSAATTAILFCSMEDSRYKQNEHEHDNEIGSDIGV